MVNAPAVIDHDTVMDRIFITVEGEEKQYTLGEYGLSIDSTDREILSRMAEVVQAEMAVDISQHYKVRKAVANRNIYIYPNSTAG